MGWLFNDLWESIIVCSKMVLILPWIKKIGFANPCVMIMNASAGSVFNGMFTIVSSLNWIVSEMDTAMLRGVGAGCGSKSSSMSGAPCAVESIRWSAPADAAGGPWPGFKLTGQRPGRPVQGLVNERDAGKNRPVQDRPPRRRTPWAEPPGLIEQDRRPCSTSEQH